MFLRECARQKSGTNEARGLRERERGRRTRAINGEKRREVKREKEWEKEKKAAELGQPLPPPRMLLSELCTRSFHNPPCDTAIEL